MLWLLFVFLQFYGPQNFHPATTNDVLRRTPPEFSSSPYIENQSLYWHPSIYRKTDESGQQKFTRVSNLETSPYYRWNKNSVPETVEFPEGFRMIAYSNQDGAAAGGELGGNLLVECCDMNNGVESCTETTGTTLNWPTRTCDFVGIAFCKSLLIGNVLKVYRTTQLIKLLLYLPCNSYAHLLG